MAIKVVVRSVDIHALYLAKRDARRRRNLIRSTLLTAFGFIMTVIAAFRWAL